MQYLFTSSSSVPYVLAIILLALIGFASTQEVLLREGNHFEVYRQLEVNEAWGVNFQVASGTIFFRVSFLLFSSIHYLCT